MKTKEINEFIRTNPKMPDDEIAKRCGISPQGVRNRKTRLGIGRTFTDQVDDEKSKIIRKQEKQSRQKEAREQARFELLLDTLKTAITPLEFTQPKVNLPKHNGGDEEEACLLLSDLHFGKKTETYDLEIAAKRFQKVVDGVLSITHLHQNAYPIKKLHIFWNGDIVDGECLFPNHAHQVDDHVVNQIYGSMPHVVGQLSRLASIFEVHNHCVRGNHGRVRQEAHFNANWDNVFYQSLKLATANIPNMTWDIPLGWQQIVEVNKTKILQVHGHQIKMQLNLPWYGITTRVSRWATSQGLGGFDVATLGHFHSSSNLRWGNRKIFTNGTTVSGDEFALEFMGLESSEMQWLFGVHPRKKVTWQYEIRP